MPMGWIRTFLCLGLLMSTCLAWAYPNSAISCRGGITVFIEELPIRSGMAASVAFRASNGSFVEESGVLMVRNDGSLAANTKSIFVYGNEQGTGYYVIAPSRDPVFAGCKSSTRLPREQSF